MEDADADDLLVALGLTPLRHHLHRNAFDCVPALRLIDKDCIQELRSEACGSVPIPYGVEKRLLFIAKLLNGKHEESWTVYNTILRLPRDPRRQTMVMDSQAQEFLESLHMSDLKDILVDEGWDCLPALMLLDEDGLNRLRRSGVKLGQIKRLQTLEKNLRNTYFKDKSFVDSNIKHCNSNELKKQETPEPQGICSYQCSQADLEQKSDIEDSNISDRNIQLTTSEDITSTLELKELEYINENAVFSDICGKCNESSCSIYRTYSRKLFCSNCVRCVEGMQFYPSVEKCSEIFPSETLIDKLVGRKQLRLGETFKDIHFGCVCEGICDSNTFIKGLRYLCVTCLEKDIQEKRPLVDYSFCSECVDHVMSMQLHDSSHTFLIIASPQDVLPTLKQYRFKIHRGVPEGAHPTASKATVMTLTSEFDVTCALAYILKEINSRPLNWELIIHFLMTLHSDFLAKSAEDENDITMEFHFNRDGNFGATRIDLAVDIDVRSLSRATRDTSRSSIASSKKKNYLVTKFSVTFAMRREFSLEFEELDGDKDGWISREDLRPTWSNHNIDVLFQGLEVARGNLYQSNEILNLDRNSFVQARAIMRTFAECEFCGKMLLTDCFKCKACSPFMEYAICIDCFDNVDDKEHEHDREMFQRCEGIIGNDGKVLLRKELGVDGCRLVQGQLGYDCEYYQCHDCKLETCSGDVICDVCARTCHEGHDISVAVTNASLPEYCRCVRGECCSFIDDFTEAPLSCTVCSVNLNRSFFVTKLGKSGKNCNAVVSAVCRNCLSSCHMKCFYPSRIALQYAVDVRTRYRIHRDDKAYLDRSRVGDIHWGVSCQGICGDTLIEGCRYVCTVCFESGILVNLCENCVKLKMHDPMHAFALVYFPQDLLWNRNKWSQHIEISKNERSLTIDVLTLPVLNSLISFFVKDSNLMYWKQVAGALTALKEHVKRNRISDDEKVASRDWMECTFCFMYNDEIVLKIISRHAKGKCLRFDLSTGIVTPWKKNLLGRLKKVAQEKTDESFNFSPELHEDVRQTILAFKSSPRNYT